MKQTFKILLSGLLLMILSNCTVSKPKLDPRDEWLKNVVGRIIAETGEKIQLDGSVKTYVKSSDGELIPFILKLYKVVKSNQAVYMLDIHGDISYLGIESHQNQLILFNYGDIIKHPNKIAFSGEKTVVALK